MPAKKTLKEQESEKRFEQDLILRGDAAKSCDGKLPPGATHEILDPDKKGEVKVVRRRFSAV